MTTPPDHDRLLELLVEITEVPAPTFAEQARADLVADRLEAAGLDVRRDAAGNVLAELSGTGPTVAVAAHLDTVFPADADVTVRRDADRWSAPGIGDNSASLAVLVHWVERQARGDDARPRTLIAATVGEEGLGDLRGARRVVAEHELDGFVALDGHLGTVVDRAVGSKRFELRVHAAGGHSWGDFPSPSAVHALGDLIAAFNRLPVPPDPRSSYNVGQTRGGRSINAIAEDAWCNLDLRSLDPGVLDRLEREARTRIRRVARAHDVTIEVEQVGDRPAATVPNDALVAAAQDALHAVGVPCRRVASSTDANAALAAGVPAIAFGVYEGGDAHRESEWLDPSSLRVGYEAFARLMASLGR